MGIAEKIYQHSLRLPDEAARQALAFIEFLEQQSQRQTAMNQPLAHHRVMTKRQAGSAKNQLVIIQDDAHLADFQEY